MGVVNEIESKLYILGAQSKIIYPKYSKHLPYTVAHTNPLLICTGFLKYPFGHLFQTEIKIDFKTN